MSREDYDLLPEGPPYYDYVNGEAVELNRPSAKHQQIMFRLSNLLWEHVTAHDLGMVAADIDVELPGGSVFAPDILFLGAERLSLYDESKGDLHGVPDLIVEIHSASTRAYDRQEKMAFCHAAQVGWIWFVAQEDLVVEEFVWTAERYLAVGGVQPGQVFRPHLFPDLEIDLNKLMGNP